jgi:hypothetical protein
MEITDEERDALREQVLTHLDSIDDLRMAYEAEDFSKTERLGIEFGDELRLMEDLGWGHAPTGQRIKLTMPLEQLHRVFTRLRSDVEEIQAYEEQEEAEAQSENRLFRERARRVEEVCERLLCVAAGPPPPPSCEKGAQWGA